MFTDIHTHVLPALDDGAASLAETVEMLRQAHGAGTRTVIATPHLYSDCFPGVTVPLIQEVFRQTVASLRELALGDVAFLAEMRFGLGAEHYLSPPFLEALGVGQVIPLANSRYLLLEFPVDLPSPMMVSGARRVIQAGYYPVLAHVERYAAVRRNPNSLLELRELGCVAQVNVRSLSRERKGTTCSLARDLLKRGFAQIVASDGHDPRERPMSLGRERSQLEGHVPLRLLRSAFESNPAAIVGSAQQDQPSPKQDGSATCFRSQTASAGLCFRQS